MESILTSIKKLIGIDEEDTSFDTDVIIHINTAFMSLTDLKVGPSIGFIITDKTAVWTDFIRDPKKLAASKTYVYLRVKLVFDPGSLSSATIASMEKQVEKLEWLLNVDAESGDTNELAELEKLVEELTSENAGLKSLVEELTVRNADLEMNAELLIDKANDFDLWYEASEKITNFGNMFMGWKFEKLPRMNLINLLSMSYQLCDMAVKRIDFYLDTKTCSNFGTAFGNCEKLEYVKGINTSKAKSVNSMFRRCISLRIIEEPFDLSSITETTINMFPDGVVPLEEVRFVKETIKKSIIVHSIYLSDESVQSIIDGLATVEKKQTLTLMSLTTNKLTDEQWNQIWDKNWEVN